MKILNNLLKWLLFVIPAVLLVVPDNMFFPFISGKGILFRFLVEIALALYLFAVWKDSNLRPQKSWLLLSVLLFAVIVFLADSFSTNFGKAFWSNFERMEGFVLIAHLFVYFVMLGSVLRTLKDRIVIFHFTIAVSVAMSLFALLQISGGTAINQGATRLDALMGNSAYFAGFLMFQIFIILFLLKREWSAVRNIVWTFCGGSLLFTIVYLIGEKSSTAGLIIMFASLIFSALMVWLSRIFDLKKAKFLSFGLFGLLLVSHVWLLFLTQTRGAGLGFLGGVLVVSLLVAIFEKNKQLRIYAFAVLGTTVLLVGGFIAIKDSSFIQHSPILKRFADISWSKEKNQARQIIWPMAIEGFKEKPMLGWGQEGFNYVFAKYYNPELYRHEPWFDRTHNVFLDWLVAAGILGLLAYLSIYIMALLAIKKAFFRDDKTSFAILAGLLSAYAFQNMFIFDNLGSYILFFSFIAFLHAETAIDKNLTPIKTRGSEEINPILVGGICAGIFVLLTYFFSYRPYIQNTSLIKGLSPQADIHQNLNSFRSAFSLRGAGVSESREHFMGVLAQIVSAPNIDMKIKQEFFDEALKQAELQYKEAPLESKPLLAMATNFNQINNPDIALSLLEKARQNSPKNQHVLTQTGISYLIKNDLDSAYKTLKESYQLAPGSSASAMLFASVAINKGEREEAYEILSVLAKGGRAPASYIIADLKRLGLKQKAIEFLESAYKVSKDENLRKAIDELKQG